MRDETASPGFRFAREEIPASQVDLGTFLPLAPGHIPRCGMSPAPVFFFSGLWDDTTGILSRGILRGKKNGCHGG